jgi:hypothetical protein
MRPSAQDSPDTSQMVCGVMSGFICFKVPLYLVKGIFKVVKPQKC